MARDVVKVSRSREGLDLTFLKAQHAQRFVACLRGIAPCRVEGSKSVVATNARTGASNVKHTWLVEVPPLCRDDLVLLPRGLGSGGLALVQRVGASLHLVEPSTGRAVELASDAYWRTPLVQLASRAQMHTFHVLDCEPDERQLPRHAAGAGVPAGSDAASVCSGASRASVSSRASARGRPGGPAWVMADALVVRESELGVAEGTFVRTHVGHLLQAGDEARGYDLRSMAALEELPAARDVAEIVLLGKRQEKTVRGGASARRRRKRAAAEARERGSEAASDLSYQDELGELLEADAEGLQEVERMLMGFGLEECGEEEDDEQDEGPPPGPAPAPQRG